MYVGIKIDKNGEFAGVLGIFSTPEKFEGALKSLVVNKDQKPKLLMDTAAGFKLYDAPVDDFPHMLEDCPLVEIDYKALKEQGAEILKGRDHAVHTQEVLTGKKVTAKG